MQTSRKIVSATLIVLGLIHLLPLAGVLGPPRLYALYGLDFTDPNLAILMRHRAVLFGLLGVFVVSAAFRRPLQAIALVAAAISVVSFLALAWSTGGYNALVAKVVVADQVALAALVIGGCAYLVGRRSD
jgi:hypothetical protein